MTTRPLKTVAGVEDLVGIRRRKTPKAVFGQVERGAGLEVSMHCNRYGLDATTPPPGICAISF